MTKTQSAINDLVKVLEKQQALKDKYQADNAKWESTKAKIEQYLLESGETVDNLPDVIKEQEPYLAWKISGKTDESLIAAHMQIDDKIIPQLENELKAIIEPLKEQKETLEQYALAVLNERKCSNFGVTGVGRVENRTNVRYSVSDKKLFVADALKNGYADEITVTIRPNSKLLAGIVEETGELPSGVSSHREQKAVFVKGS